MKELKPYGNVLISKDGEVYNAVYQKIPVKDGMFHCNFNGKRRCVFAKRAVYEAFTGEVIPKNKYYIECDNEDRPSFESIRLIPREEYFEGHDWSMMHKYDEETENAMRKDFETGQYTKNDLAKKYGCNPATVRKILNRG